MKPSKSDIAAEVTALQGLVPVGPNARRTAAAIEIQIEALQHGVDETAAEWNDLSESEQIAATDAASWANGTSREKPSTGWGSLCKA